MNIKQYMYFVLVPLQLFGAASSSIDPYKLMTTATLNAINGCLKDAPRMVLYGDPQGRMVLHGLVDRARGDRESIMKAIEETIHKRLKMRPASWNKYWNTKAIVNQGGASLTPLEYAAYKQDKDFLKLAMKCRTPSKISISHAVIESNHFDHDFEFYTSMVKHEKAAKERRMFGKKGQIVVVNPWVPSALVKKMVCLFKGRALEFLLSTGYNLNTSLGDGEIIYSTEPTLINYFKRTYPEDYKLLKPSNVHMAIYHYAKRIITLEDFNKQLGDIRESMSKEEFMSLCRERRLAPISAQESRVLHPINLALGFKNRNALRSMSMLGARISPYVVGSSLFDKDIGMYDILVRDELQPKVCRGWAGVFEPTSITIERWLPRHLVEKVIGTFGEKGADLLCAHNYNLGTSLTLLSDGSVDPQGETAFDLLMKHPDYEAEKYSPPAPCPIQ